MNHQTVIRSSSAAFWPADGRVVRTADFDRALAVFAGGIRKAAQWHRRQRAAAELRSLNDQELKDIGLCRSEILSVVNTGDFERKVRRHAHN